MKRERERRNNGSLEKQDPSRAGRTESRQCWDIVHLAEHWPSMLKALGLIPALHKPDVVCAYNLSPWERKIGGPESHVIPSWWHIAVNPALARLRQEEFEFISRPGYIVGSRLP